MRSSGLLDRVAGRRAPRSTRARRSAARPPSSVWRPCARLPSMPMRMSLNSRNATPSVRRPLRAASAGARRVPTASMRQSPPRRLDHRPARRRRAVVEHRLADDLDLDLALDALDHAHQQVVGVVVGRRARVAGAVLVVVPVADRQRVEHAHPALRRHPGRLDHVRARDVAPARRHVEAVGPDPPAAGAAVEHRARTPTGESKWGRHIHSIEPSEATSAPVWQSERKP